MQKPHKLVPTVRESGDRLTVLVKSRSGKGEYRVDFERRAGLGQCSCKAYEKGGHFDCYHLTQARKFMTCLLAQRMMELELAK